MDALKRAEKARQAEASSDGAEIDPASTQGFSLDPIDNPAAERGVPAEGRTAPPPAPQEPQSDSPFELENTSELRDRLEIDPIIEAHDEEGGEIELEGLDEDSLSLDADEIRSEGALPDDTAATLPSVRSAQRSVKNYFDGTGSGTNSSSLTVDDLQAAMADETQRRERVSADTDTQRRVRAVFHAKEAGRGRRGRNWAMIAAVPLLLVLIVGALVFVFWDAMTELVGGGPVVASVREGEGAAAARSEARVAAASQSANQTNSETTGQTSSQAGSQSASQQAGSGAASGVESAPGGTAAQAAATPSGTGRDTQGPLADGRAGGDDAVTSELKANAPSVADVTGEGTAASASTGAAGRAAAAPADANEKVARAIRERGLAAASPAGDSAFSIRRRSVPDRLHPQLERAYAALQSGNYEEAKRGYSAALRSDPRNRNAHLGLAAIAVSEGDMYRAAELYANLLRLNPRDTAAQAALISLQENVDPLRSESRIKLLLREEPQAPYLHFTLGNLYAEQGRWAEAQSAYFNAYRLQPENADYAYNLAVSLDQLSKSRNALDYYRRALELAGVSRAAFEPAVVLARIQSMSSEAESQ